MITKIKLAAAVIVLVAVITSVVCMYVYINKLNNKITDFNVIIANQKNEIELLNNHIDDLSKNIDLLKSNVDLLKNTLSVTSNYVSTVEKAYSDEDALKQTIYEETISNEEVRDWFSEKLPDDLLDLLNTHSYNSVCNN